MVAFRISWAYRLLYHNTQIYIQTASAPQCPNTHTLQVILTLHTGKMKADWVLIFAVSMVMFSFAAPVTVAKTHLLRITLENIPRLTFEWSVRCLKAMISLQSKLLTGLLRGIFKMLDTYSTAPGPRWEGRPYCRLVITPCRFYGFTGDMVMTFLSAGDQLTGQAPSLRCRQTAQFAFPSCWDQTASGGGVTDRITFPSQCELCVFTRRVSMRLSRTGYGTQI